MVFGTGCFSSGDVFSSFFRFAIGIFIIHSCFFPPFFVWDMFLVVLDLALWVCVDHSSRCFSFGIALFIAFPILAFTLFPIC